MSDWRTRLRRDPVRALWKVDDAALRYFVRRDLLGERVGPKRRAVWSLPEVERVLRGQRPDGSFPYPGTKMIGVWPSWHDPLVETWKRLRVLVQQHELTKTHPGCAAAAEYVLSCQTDEGDIRGFIGNQYATYYTGALMGLLCRAGYARDPRVEHALRWLLTMRQNDGGWTVPIQTHHLSRQRQHRLTRHRAEPLAPVRALPFAHNATGMVLRGFAEHPVFRRRKAIRDAGRLLASRLFEPDAYTSYRAPEYWVRFQFPFWWNNLVAALDTLSRLRFRADDPDVARGVRWLRDHQRADGLWDLHDRPTTGRPATAMRAWVGLAVCRVLQRLQGHGPRR